MYIMDFKFRTTVRIWIVSWICIVSSLFCVIGGWVYSVDPYFHYHKPDTEKFYYYLYNERLQNDGISKQFDYDTMITGTSMTENFRTTEMDEIFGSHSIKVPYSGGTYKEINDNIERALKANPKLNLVIRCLDMGKFFDSADLMRIELGDYPYYLYDDNLFNDFPYLFNRYVVFDKVYQMTKAKGQPGFQGGITSFDDYARWQDKFTFGKDSVCPEGIVEDVDVKQLHLTDYEKKIIKENILKNVTNIADEYPNVQFYYFYSPYSIYWWAEQKNEGNLCRQLETEKYITELIIQHDNIHLFSFNNCYEIIQDLNNYKDDLHYASWINSLMLKWMHDNNYQITKDNYEEYFRKEYEYYTTMDYSSILDQEDYEADYYAAALLNQQLTGAAPRILSDIIENDHASEFVVNMDDGYNYLSFNGEKIADGGAPIVHIYNRDGELVGCIEGDSMEIENDCHQYVLDLSTVKGEVKINFEYNKRKDENNSSPNYIYSDIYIY